MCTCTQGYTGTECELEICSGTSIHSRAEVDQNRLCAEIDGDLDISAIGLTSIGPDDFPHLTRIRGSLIIRDIQNGQPVLLQGVTLSKLEKIDEAISVNTAAPFSSNVGPFSLLLLPQLREIGQKDQAGLVINGSGIVELGLPLLETIGGKVNLGALPNLCSVDLRRVMSVAGTVSIQSVPKVAKSSFDALAKATTENVSESTVGCCFASSLDKLGCESFTSSSTACSACP